jgi:Skp family chaperone for outer membrane proteins
MTTKFSRFLLPAALVLSLTCLAQTGNAAAPAAAAAVPSVAGPTRIGVISMQEAIVATNEGQRDFEALGKKFEPKRAELKNLSDELDSMKKQLNDGKVTEDSRANLVKTIEQKQKSFTRSQEDAQNDFQQQQNEIATKILQKLGPVIDKYAKDNGLGLILDVSQQWPQGPVLWAGQGVDITKPIVDAYNAQSGVPAPAPSAPSAARPGTGAKPAAPTPKPPAPKPN